VHLILRFSTLAISLLSVSQAVAEIQPDAGRILKEFAVPLEPIKPSVDFHIEESKIAEPIAPGGKTVEIRSVRFEGATKIGAERLQNVVPMP
jgi:hypothetical protein